MFKSLLLGAAKILRKGGFCKGLRKNGFGQHCALGAMDSYWTGEHKRYRDRSWNEDLEAEAMRDYIVGHKVFGLRIQTQDTYNHCLPWEGSKNDLPRVETAIAGFNNHPDTTIDDVIQVFRSSARKAKDRKNK